MKTKKWIQMETPAYRRSRFSDRKRKRLTLRTLQENSGVIFKTFLREI